MIVLSTKSSILFLCFNKYTFTPNLSSVSIFSINSWFVSIFSIYSNDIPSSFNLATCSGVGLVPSWVPLYTAFMRSSFGPIVSSSFNPLSSMSFIILLLTFSSSNSLFSFFNCLIVLFTNFSIVSPEPNKSTFTPNLASVSIFSINSWFVSIFSNVIPSSFNLATCSGVGLVPSWVPLYTDLMFANFGPIVSSSFNPLSSMSFIILLLTFSSSNSLFSFFNCLIVLFTNFSIVSPEPNKSTFTPNLASVSIFSINSWIISIFSIFSNDIPRSSSIFFTCSGVGLVPLWVPLYTPLIVFNFDPILSSSFNPLSSMSFIILLFSVSSSNSLFSFFDCLIVLFTKSSIVFVVANKSTFTPKFLSVSIFSINCSMLPFSSSSSISSCNSYKSLIVPSK